MVCLVVPPPSSPPSRSQLCLESGDFCDALTCYDCACVSLKNRGLLGAEKICASSETVATGSVPATTLAAVDDCSMVSG